MTSLSGNTGDFLLDAFAEAASDGFVAFDAALRITTCNTAAAHLLGIACADVLGRSLADVLPGIAATVSLDKGDVRIDGACVAPSQPATIVTLSSDRTNGGAQPHGWTIRRHFDSAGKFDGGIAVHRAAESFARIESQLRESEQRLRDFVDSATDWFWETDRDLRYSYVSEMYQQATGLPPESRLGFRRGEFRLQGPDDGDWDQHLTQLAERRPFRDFSFAYLDASGQRRVAQVSGRPVFDDSGEFTGYRGVGRDITAEVEAQKRLMYVAHHDPLTGLPNRTLLKERLENNMGAVRRHTRGLAVLTLDLDDFKSVNDTLGHAAGDAVLSETAVRICEAVRAGDTVGRLGGDEFTILQAEARDRDDAEALARRLISILSEPFELGGERIHCGASVGISRYPGDGNDADDLLRHANLALYKAKSAGRNSLCFFTPAMNEEVRERRLLEAELRQALKQDDFVLYFQPQIDLQTGRLVGLEALLRWPHPRLGFVAPGAFLPVAERSGLILGIDRWVLKHACIQAKQWIDDGLLTACVAVNSSAMQLAQRDMTSAVERILHETGFPPEQLEIEITESVLLVDTEVVTATLEAIHQLGVSLAVDDFGTGYSSLTYLRRFPVQKVKVDRTFIRNICTNTDDAAITGAIISLSKALKLTVIAEGIETKGQLDYLRLAGCDQAQGYYIGRPMSAADCTALLRSRAGLEARHPALLLATGGQTESFLPAMHGAEAREDEARGNNAESQRRSRLASRQTGT
ncbi:MAG: EAL domain-containing protein [Rhodospirillales bacterium]|nr:EAL domain-containing protein [Rhodospirillales bacterium]